MVQHRSVCQRRDSCRSTSRLGAAISSPKIVTKLHKSSELLADVQDRRKEATGLIVDDGAVRQGATERNSCASRQVRTRHHNDSPMTPKQTQVTNERFLPGHPDIQRTPPSLALFGRFILSRASPEHWVTFPDDSALRITSHRGGVALSGRSEITVVAVDLSKSLDTTCHSPKAGAQRSKE
jgi:hypothetical protein